MKINRIICYVLMLLIVLSFASCASVTDTSKSDDSVADGLSSSNPDTVYEPVFLMVTYENDNTTDDKLKLKEEFKVAEQYGVGVTSSMEVIDSLNKSTLKNPINNKNMEYSYSKCSYKNNSSKEYGTHYSVYDVYTTGDTDIKVLHDTDLICYYFNRQNDVDGAVKLTDEKAKSVADTFLSSVVGDEILSAFDIISVKADTSGFFSYVVNYTRLINGHKTDENMTVFIGKSGTVVAYNGYNLCKYEALKEKFDGDKITAAKDLLVSKINSLGLKNLSMKDYIVTTDVDGELYVSIDFSYEDNYGMACAETALVNVN